MTGTRLRAVPGVRAATMCEHCGCRGVEPIAELMDEHLALLELSGEIRRRLAAGEHDAVRRLLAELDDKLTRHVGREERGVFTAMKDQGDFVDAVEELEREHVSLDLQLHTLDLGAADVVDSVQALLDELSRHIDKENLGVFPVAVVSLGARGWDTITDAHEHEPSFLAIDEARVARK